MRKLLAVAVLAACGPEGRDTSIDAAPQPDAAGDAAPPVDTSRVYAHSGDSLYRLNSVTLAATPIGTMTGLGGQALLDLAIDKDDLIVGVTADKLYTLSATTGAATLKLALPVSARGMTSLSYVPQSLTDPASPDILVSADADGDVLQIDLVTGEATVIGNYGTAAGGVQIRSSGDLFGVRGVGIFATVDVGPADGEDYLARIDPAQNWRAIPLGIGTGYNKIFGLGYWGGKIYGFVDNGFDPGGGKMIEIDPNTGAGTLLSAANIRWFGAGVATDAPVLQ